MRRVRQKALRVKRGAQRLRAEKERSRERGRKRSDDDLCQYKTPGVRRFVEAARSERDSGPELGSGE